MKTYRIEQTKTGAVLFEGQASSEKDALDKMAREAGYDDYASAESVTGNDDGIVVTEVKRLSVDYSKIMPAITASEMYSHYGEPCAR